MLELTLSACRERRTEKGPRMVIDVAAKNATEEILYACNWLSDYFEWFGDFRFQSRINDRARMSQGIAFVGAGTQDDLVVLLQGNGPRVIPKGLDGVMPRNPLQSKFKPGEVLSWSLELPLPLREWHSFVPPLKEDTTAVLVHRIEYRLQYVLESNSDYHRHFPSCDVPKEGRWYVSGEPTRFAVATATLDSPITLLRRNDPDFVRFEGPRSGGPIRKIVRPPT